MKYNNNFTIDQLEEIVYECNSWNGTLGYFLWYRFDDEFFEMAFPNNPLEAARACFFGEINSWCDDYIRFNGYGNLESCNDWQYKKQLEDNAEEIINTAIEERKNGVEFSPEINMLLDSLKK